MNACEYCGTPRAVDAFPCPGCAAEPTSEWLSAAGIPETVFGAASAIVGEDGMAALQEAARGVREREREAPTVYEANPAFPQGAVPPSTAPNVAANHTLSDGPARQAASPSESIPDMDVDGLVGPNTLMKRPGPPASDSSRLAWPESLSGPFEAGRQVETAPQAGASNQPTLDPDVERELRPASATDSGGTSGEPQATTQMLDQPDRLPLRRPRATAGSSVGARMPAPVLTGVGSVTLDTSAREVVRYARTMDPDDPASVLKVQALLESLITQQEAEAVPGAAALTLSKIEEVIASEPEASAPTGPIPESIPDFAAHLMDWARDVSVSGSLTSVLNAAAGPHSTPVDGERQAGSGRIHQSIASLTATLEASTSESMLIGEVDDAPDSEQEAQAWDAFDGLGLGRESAGEPQLPAVRTPGIPAPLDGGRVTVADGRVRVAASSERLAAKRRNVHGAAMPAAEPELNVDALADARPNRPDRFSQQPKAVDELAARAPAPAPKPVPVKPARPDPALTPPPVSHSNSAELPTAAPESPWNVRVIGAIGVGVLIGSILMWLLSR